MNFLLSYAKETDLHGLGHIDKRKPTALNLLWLTLTLCGIGAVVFFSTGIGTTYASHKMSTEMRVLTQTSMKLPNPLICIGHRFNQSQIKKHNISAILVSALQFVIGVPVPFFSNDAAKPNFTELENYRPELERLKRKLGSYDSLIDDLTLKCEDLIISCKPLWKTKNLDCCKSATVYSLYTGTCVLLQGINQDLSTDGMQIELKFPYPEEITPLPWSDMTDGMTLQLLQTSQLTSAAVTGFKMHLKPGERLVLAVQLTKTIAVNNHPQYTCIAKNEYDQMNCYVNCVAKAFPTSGQEQPNCTAVTMQPRVIGGIKGQLPACDPWQTYSVVEGAMTELNRTEPIFEECGYECPTSCTKSQYQVEKERLPFDRKKYKAFTLSDSETDVIMKQRGFVELKYEKKEVTIIEQRMSMTVMDVVASMGGFFGLFVGGSLISLVHGVVYVIEYCFFAAIKRQTVSVDIKQ